MVKIEKLKGSFTYAFYGWQFALKNDQNIRIHLLVALLVLAASFYFNLSFLETGILVAMMVLVISCELMNTAVEKMVDLITTEHRMDAKFAKDVSSAMVLTSAVGSVIVGLIIFFPHVFS
ncbi:MAG: diacylglycerol kinase family protein [bacterium]|nr:diacylglycerol kinase family protein [bacterium]